MKRLFYIIFLPCLAAILAVAVLFPQNNLVPSRMFLYMLVWAAILSGIKKILEFVENRIKKTGIDILKISQISFIIYVILYGIALYLVSAAIRSDPITDYKEIYQTALRLATGEEVSDWNYFSMWTNNLGALTILTFLMRIGLVLGFSDVYYFLLGLNVLQMMAVMASIYYLAGKISKKPDRVCINTSVQWFAVVLFTLWTPVWTGTTAFYTDQLSFGSSVIAIALLWYAASDAREQKGRKWTCAILAGVIWGIGISAKVTSAIALVALVILGSLFLVNYLKEYGHQLYKWRAKLLLFLVFTISLCLTFGGLYAYDQTYPSKADEYRLKMPAEYWIAMGLVGNGTYSDNAYLIRKCNYSQNIEERQQVCRKIIRDNLINILDIDHMYKKTSIIFGSGDICPTSLQYPEQETFLWQLFYWEGAYYWKYTCTSTGFFNAVLLFMCIGCFVQAKWYKEDDFMFFCYLTVFGVFLFLMFWEAQNKQLFNHISWMTLAVVCSMERIKKKKD